MPVEASGVVALQHALEHRLGLDFSGARQSNLMRALTSLAHERASSIDDCARQLAETAAHGHLQADCVRHLTVAETYFFREQRAFELVTDYAREKFASLGPQARVRLWSAGCCTGEESYSAAIALQRALPAEHLARCSVLGTDINADSLCQAQEGSYGRRSFRNGERAGVHFLTTPGEQLRVAAPARDIVSFAHHNLASAEWPLHLQAMDIILCRNVLMYFSPAQARRCIERFHACLLEGGWLVVSPSEATPEMFPGFEVVRHPDAIWFRKTALAVREHDKTTVRVTRRAPRRLAPPERSRVHHRCDVNLENDPARAQACCRLACALAEADRIAEAMQQLRRALYLDSQCLLAVCLQAMLLARQRHSRQARMQLQAALNMLQTMPPQTLVPGSDSQTALDMQYSLQATLAALAEHEATA